MPLLITSDAIAERRRIAAGALAPLADSLTADLERVVAAGIRVPREKALLSRAGGYCERDGSALAFDPWSPHEHRCPTCGQVHHGVLHDRWWLYPYHLWLAERAVHAAALYAVRGDDRHAVFARDVLRQYAETYLTYPNRDNVLGPTRPFFSTYLESIWLLQLCVALDLLETADDRSVGAEFRNRVVEPSAALIAGYNEGTSNRQIWNNAALLAAYVLLGDDHALEPLVAGPSGLLAHLEDGILDDGTWYEGENYHQFAHRGLWYGLTLAERAGVELPRAVVERFERGFAATFATALPDLTLPARKDSQYGTSLRQWRFAESCELGLARGEDPALVAMLARLYDGTAPAGDTGRASASAEAERNVRGVRLTRADLGWKSLLFAREQVVAAGRSALPSVLLHGQGIAVLRRPGGDGYVALDYGQSGGGHGHPDRLNVLFCTGASRWLDDLGTASYVDPSLHWYRSTLAHNAPMVGGHSQWRVDGVLEAFDEQGDAGWVRANATIWPGVAVQRTLVVMSGYFVDETRWRAGHDGAFMLPIHCDGALSGQIKQVRAQYTGAGGHEDGDRFVTTERAFRVAAGATVQLTANHGTDEVRAFMRCQSPATWYTLSGPGQPPGAIRRFHVIESHGTPVGVIRAVWAWSRDVESVEWAGDGLIVHHRGGMRHLHARTGDGWHVDVDSNGEWRTIELGGARGDRELTADAEQDDGTPNPDQLSVETRGDPAMTTDEPVMRGFHGLVLAPSRFATAWWTDAPPEERSRFAAYHLGEPTYRRSEETWEEAGRPSARVAIAAAAKLLVVDVQVTTPSPRFVPAGAVNPYDNESADINGDGVQLYVRTIEDGGAWVLVPDAGGKAGLVRARPLAGWGDLRLARVAWRRVREGYELRAEIALRQPLEVGSDFALDVLVNETAPGRERRRGQLILSGPDGEFVYLRGDRHDPARLLHFTIVT